VPERSVASASFAEALKVVRSRRLDPVDRPPPLAFIGSGEPGPKPDAAPERSLPTGGGPLAEALADQRSGAVSSLELVEACLAQIERRDGPLMAIVELDAEGARSEAVAADRDRVAGRWRGPLHGIPMTVKDIIDVVGFTTRAGSAAFSRRAVCEGAAVTRLREAGAVIIGKVSTHEFALGVTNPQSRNPYDPSRIPGGSSGGSAISVATRMALASLGTDTRASIRVPAALCGVVGLKATHGAVPASGIVSLSWTMDHVAPVAATVTDAAIVLQALLAEGSPFRLTPAANLRLGVAEATFAGVDPPVVRAVMDALDGLMGTTGSIQRAVPEPSAASLDIAGAAGLVVSRCEAAAVHRSLGLDRSLYWPEVADQLDAADRVTAVDYLDAQRTRGQLAETLLTCFEEVDLLVMPTAPTVAPIVEDAPRHLMTLARNAIPWSFVGFPAMSLPVGLVDGLPVGLQLVAPPHREGLLIAAGLAVEAAVGFLPAPDFASFAL